jgi:hypothetical protein
VEALAVESVVGEARQKLAALCQFSVELGRRNRIAVRSFPWRLCGFFSHRAGTGNPRFRAAEDARFAAGRVGGGGVLLLRRRPLRRRDEPA